MSGNLVINDLEMEKTISSDDFFSDMDDFFKEELEDDELFLPDMTFENSRYSFMIYDLDYKIIIDTKNKDLNDILNDKKDYLKGLKECKEINELRDDYDKVLNKINELENSFDTFFDDVEFVELILKNNNFKEFIDKYPILKNKKIVLHTRIGLEDEDKLKEYLNDFSDIKENIFLFFNDDNYYVSLEDAYKTINTVYEKVIKIKDLNLSPMETIMYVYDIVRSREYNMEESEEDAIESRNLSKVLYGDKIVCSGFAKLFKGYLDKLKIHGYLTQFLLENDLESGHERNVMYVKDEKYNIDGVYYFDPTWDCKSNSNNNYLYSYRYFAKTIKEINSTSKGFINKNIPCFDKNLIDSFYEGINNNESISVLFDYVNSVRFMSTLVNEESLLNTDDALINKDKTEEEITEMKDRYSKIYDKFVREIPAETMIKLLLNVRKIEYYQNPELYSFDYNTFLCIFKCSNWKFKDNYTFESRLAEMLEIDFVKNYKNEFNNFMAFENIEKEINQVKLAKSLRLVLDKKQNK